MVMTGVEREHAAAPETTDPPAEGNGLLNRVDGFQQRHPLLAFPAAVVRKYGDDGGGKLVAQLAYAGFLSLFPLLLVITTVLSFVVAGNPDLQDDLLDSALVQFPIIGNELRTNVGAVQGSGLALAIGLATSVWGGIGVAQAAQDVLGTVWLVPHRRRPSFLARLARALLMFLVLGGGLVTTSALAATGTLANPAGVAGSTGVFLASVLVNSAWFALAFKILLPAAVSWREALPGSLLAAVGWQVLLLLGSTLVDHQLRGATAAYGFFGIVLGLLAWLAVLATLLVLAAEVNVVAARRLWPRGFIAPPTTPSDHVALEATAKVQERLANERIDVRFDASEDDDDVQLPLG